jgi:hypothetical protein
MAFDAAKLDITGSGSKGAKVCATYENLSDSAATIKADGYFDSVAEHMARVGAITVFASDATFQAKVTVTTGDVALAALDAFA